mgnify:CR=1 FL=1
MGYREDEEKKKMAAALLKDREWFADRMSALVEELKGVVEPARAGYLRGCLNAAKKVRRRLARRRPMCSHKGRDGVSGSVYLTRINWIAPLACSAFQAARPT